MTIALDLLGLGSKYWEIKETIKAIKETNFDFMIGCFDAAPQLFGDPRGNLKKLIKAGKISGVRVQLWYHSNHQLAPIAHLKARIPLWEKFRRENGVPVFLSHTTEFCSKNKAEIRKRIGLIRDLAPSCIPINNPEPGKGIALPDVTNETHGTKAQGGIYFASLDGQGGGNGAYDIDMFAWCAGHKTAAFNFGWIARFNLNDFKAPVPVPSKRTAGPSYKDMKAVIAMMSPVAPAPASFPGATPLEGPNLYKPNSQDTGDSREGKPLLIVPEKVIGGFEVITCDGDQIGEFAYYGNYLKTQYRYYSGYQGGINLWGYEIAEKAFRLSGSPWIWLRGGRRTYGPIYPCYRQGYFR